MSEKQSIEPIHPPSPPCHNCGSTQWTQACSSSRCNQCPDTIAQRVEIEQLRALLTRCLGALRVPENGFHHCRFCPASSPEWRHEDYCSFVAIRDEVNTLRDELRAEMSKGGW